MHGTELFWKRSDWKETRYFIGLSNFVFSCKMSVVLYPVHGWNSADIDANHQTINHYPRALCGAPTTNSTTTQASNCRNSSTDISNCCQVSFCSSQASYVVICGFQNKVFTGFGCEAFKQILSVVDCAFQMLFSTETQISKRIFNPFSFSYILIDG